MKKAFIPLFGFLGYLFLEGFIRLIILFYHRDTFSFFGIGSLPDSSWVAVIYGSSLISSWLVSMLVLTILKTRTLLYSLIMAGIFLLWRAFEIINSIQSEPSWYLFTIPIINLAGVFLAYKVYSRQNEH